jgi:hypothetical protein
MADARDILGVDRSAAPPPERKPDRKERVKRPEGMSREAFALLSGGNPIVTSQIMEGLQKEKKGKLAKPTGRGTVVWRPRPFLNQARTDGLQLVHWAKGFKDANGRVRDAHEGDYPFAKFNKKVRRPEGGGGGGGGARGAPCPCRRGRGRPEAVAPAVAPAPPPWSPRQLPRAALARSAPCFATTRRSGPASSPIPPATGAARRRTTCWTWWRRLTSASSSSPTDGT